MNVPRASSKEMQPRLVMIGIDEIALQTSAVARAMEEVAAAQAQTSKLAAVAAESSGGGVADAGDENKKSLALVIARSFDGLASGALQRLPSRLVLRPDSLAALKQLAREEFEWDEEEPTAEQLRARKEREAAGGALSNSDEESCGDRIDVYLQEGVSSGRGRRGSGGGSDSRGRRSWGGAIHNEESYQILRDGDVIEVVRSRVAPKPKTVSAALPHSTQQQQQPPSQSQVSIAVDGAHGKRKRSHLTQPTTTIEESPRSSSRIPIPRNDGGGAVAAQATQAQAATAAPAVASPASATVAASAAAAAKLALDNSPMPPLEDALGVRVAAQPVTPPKLQQEPEQQPQQQMQQQQPMDVTPPFVPAPPLAVPAPAGHAQLQLLQFQQEQLRQAHEHQAGLYAAHAAQALLQQQFLEQQHLQRIIEQTQAPAYLHHQRMQTNQLQQQLNSVMMIPAAAASAVPIHAPTVTARLGSLAHPSSQQYPQQQQQQTPTQANRPRQQTVVTPVAAVTPSSAAPAPAAPAVAAAPAAASVATPAAAAAAAAAAPGLLSLHICSFDPLISPAADGSDLVTIPKVKPGKSLAKALTAYCRYKNLAPESVKFFRMAADYRAALVGTEAVKNAAAFTVPIKPEDTPAALGWKAGDQTIMAATK